MFGGIARINGALNGVDQEVHSTHSKFKLWKWMMMKCSNPRSNNNKHHQAPFDLCCWLHRHGGNFVFCMCFVEVVNGHVAFCYNNHFVWNCPCTLGFVDEYFRVLILWAFTCSWEPLVGIGFKFSVKEKSKESYPKKEKENGSSYENV